MDPEKVRVLVAIKSCPLLASTQSIHNTLMTELKKELLIF
jgi:hypothetical protein